ncbi:conserved Plasmodium protein, unknown function [Plasmodium malariae]|uniref:SAP domain-containing protein n=1 Tax=Plasmodium malariae TaxID=5858 RepID=A0A1C3L324_PLAMA|nr:conserved Plasmodium protein, unknown function [Plasmodium malariae]
MKRHVLVAIAFFTLAKLTLMLTYNYGKMKNYFKRAFYISSIEKQNTRNNNNIMNVTIIKKRRKQFILLKKKNENNFSINVCTLHKKRKGRKGEQRLCMFNGTYNEREASDVSEANGDGQANSEDILNSRGEPHYKNNCSSHVTCQNSKDVELKNQLDSASSSGHDDGDDIEGEEEEKEKKRKKEKRNEERIARKVEKENEGSERSERSEGKEGSERSEGKGGSEGKEGSEGSERSERSERSEGKEGGEGSERSEGKEGGEGGKGKKQISKVISKSKGKNGLGPTGRGEEDSEWIHSTPEEKNQNSLEHKLDESKNIEGKNDIINGSEEDMAKLMNKYLKNDKLLNDNEKLKGLDKDKMLEEYNRLVQLMKESTDRKMREYKENEKKDIYELNERVINSSRKLNLDKLKKDIEKSFTTNDTMERNIQEYIRLFTQEGGLSDVGGTGDARTVGTDIDVGEVGSIKRTPLNPTTTVNPSSDDCSSSGIPRKLPLSEGEEKSLGEYAGSDTEFIKEKEEEENREILRKIYRGDYSNIDKFNFKFSRKDFDMMKNIDDKEKDVNEEEKKLIDGIFTKICKQTSSIDELREKETKLLKLYEQYRKENKIARDENLENLKYYNAKVARESRHPGVVSGEVDKVGASDRNGLSVSNSSNVLNSSNPSTDSNSWRGDYTDELINKNIFFNRVSNKFVEIKEEEIKEMSEMQIRDELRKRGYPTFGTFEEIKMRLLDIMKIKENNYFDVREIIKNPEEHVLSHIKLDKLKENIKQYKEQEKYGDTESKIKQVDSAIEINKFLYDPVDYLRIDTTNKFIKQKEMENNIKDNADIAKLPIVNDYNFDKEISMAEKLKKTFNFENDQRLPDQIKQCGDDENGHSGKNDTVDTIDEEEEKEEQCRREVLKYGGMQETIEEFHIKHNLSLDFLGDYICKFSNAHIQDVNKYRHKTKEEIKRLEMNQFEFLISESSINNNFIVYKFVDTNDLIKNYLTTKNIVTLIEYSNIADPVDIIHYYSPETLFMLSEEYNITIDKVIDACTKLNIKLPYGGDTHLNKNCFNLLTCYLNKYEQVRKDT